MHRTLYEMAFSLSLAKVERIEVDRSGGGEVVLLGRLHNVYSLQNYRRKWHRCDEN